MPDKDVTSNSDTTTEDIVKDVNLTDDKDTVSRADYEKLLANSRKWENRAKEGKDFKEKFEALTAEKEAASQTLEDRIKTLEAENASAKQEVEETRLTTLRNKIAAEKNLSPNLLPLLNAYTTEEEITANAELLAGVTAQQPQQSGLSPLFTQGVGGAGDHAKKDSIDSFIDTLLDK